MPAPLPRVALNDPSTLMEAGVWRADRVAAGAGPVLPSGHPVLDAQLPGGGWPVGAMIELLQVQPGTGEWGLLLPALGPVSQRACVALVGAPHVPLGPALQARGLQAQRLLCVHTDTPAARSWACEQALRCADVGAVLAWLPQVRAEALRRLHLAAHDHRKLLWVVRPVQARHESSPAPLRLLLEWATPAAMHVVTPADALDEGARHEGCVRILKRRGPPLDVPLRLPLHSPALQGLLAAARERAVRRRADAASDLCPVRPVRVARGGPVPQVNAILV